ncbi:Neoverrucotoxin subunit beta [Channa argus]|uniref:Neoverrucotoxin subunit beta n=1 Tax=Channa argus TaxID=215402 RepID=A0A6G1QNE5_CHAAH|nr:Neoverrucotoxin subunit beta [Channa argus]
MALNQIAVAALGRPFSLGMLYDARKDELYTGFTLWDKKTINENMSVHSQHSSVFEVTASDSIESKSSLLDIDASLKASFMSGLIQVEGSAKYLNDQKKFKNQSRVTLQYHATTTFEQLSVTHQEAKSLLQTVENDSATHVVTGILYGANAFFVFDSEKLDASSVQNIQGSMQAVIKKIPTFDFEGKVQIKLSDEEKALTNKFSCKFYGDFILESNPATFEDGVKTYIQLPKLLGQKQEIAVPLKVWLTPLKKLDVVAVEVKGGISIGLVRKAEKALEDIRQIEMRCNDCLEEKVLENVPQVYKKLKYFQTLCKDFTSTLQQTMAKTFPLIRAGEEDDASVEKLFDDREKSPFSYDNLNNVMTDKEREISAIRSCVDIMGGTKAKMVPNQSEMMKEIHNSTIDHALCFVFTSVERTDPNLDQLANYLYGHGSHNGENPTPPTQDQWYNTEETLIRMREKAKAFREFAINLKNNSRITFLVAAVPNKKYKGATIYHYKDGVLITEDFSKPNIPDVNTVTDRRDLIWYACDLTLDPKTASNWLTLSEGNKKATCGKAQSYPDIPEWFDPRPQVLCAQGLMGLHYWEVEWSKCYKNDVGVAVTYQRIERKGEKKESGLGSNEISWYFGEKEGLSAWHNGQVWNGPVPPTGCKRVGVFLNWPAGTLSFYDVTSRSLRHLYTFNNKFTEAVYPGFWVWFMSNYASLCSIC